MVMRIREIRIACMCLIDLIIIGPIAGDSNRVQCILKNHFITIHITYATKYALMVRVGAPHSGQMPDHCSANVLGF